ncbi:hypothetical protein [Paraburkholderia diazotrophica]|uniref:Carboxypeptidase regulatory-like domain-containing protein n=1 Tax=Paraburkholderia diazotrophica TaxID=667676 RepID=A0A1H6YUD9_9BURK|nr:hypothetical protein [Paraburkholderia diazotrophica]SEJ44903.1 hypothetical protein SAMN05192539_101177 [Paraburkholderia diazotrophica]
MKFLNPILIRLCVAFALGVASVAASAQSLPEAVSRNGVLYMTGGIGEDEAKTFLALAPRYSLRLMLTSGKGNYLADVDVKIATVDGKAILDARTDGPFLYVMLPAGRYRIVANAGRADVVRLVDVPRRGGVDLHVSLQESVTPDAAAMCPRCRPSAKL